MAGSPVLTQKNGRRMKNGKPLPGSSFALPGGGPDGEDAYPIDTPGRARNALSRIAQHGSPAQQAKVKRAVASRYKSIQVGGMQNHSNGYRRRTVDLAAVEHSHSYTHSHEGGGEEHSHTYANDSADGNGGGAGGAAGGSGETLRTPAMPKNGAFTGQSLTVRTGPGGAGLANRQRGVELARRLPVTGPDDLLVSRVQGGAMVRHRRGGNEIGGIRKNSDGTWQSSIDGHDLRPHSFQAAALREMLGIYNAGVTTAERPAMPLASPPRQPELLSQLGVANIRAFASDSDGDGDGGSDSDGDGDGGSNGLSPRGQAIYKKLCAKGMSPKVAMAMAKRAQNTKPGQFGKAG